MTFFLIRASATVVDLNGDSNVTNQTLPEQNKSYVLEKISKNKRRKAKRYGINANILSEPDPSSPSNDDVSDIPKVAGDRKQSKNNSDNSGSFKRTKANSQFFGVEPGELELKVARTVMVTIQKKLGIPPFVNNRDGFAVKGFKDGEPVFVCDLPDTFMVMNDSGDVVETHKPYYWGYARAIKVMTGKATSNVVDWFEENPIKGSIISLAVCTGQFVVALMAVEEAFSKKNDESAKEDNSEKVKVDFSK